MPYSAQTSSSDVEVAFAVALFCTMKFVDWNDRRLAKKERAKVLANQRITSLSTIPELQIVETSTPTLTETKIA